MAFSKITSAQLTPDGDEVTVTGPMSFSEDEAETDVLAVHFVLVRGEDFAHGTTVPNGAGSEWSETVGVFGSFQAGDTVQGFGVALMLAKLADSQIGTRAVQVVTWSDLVTIED